MSTTEETKTTPSLNFIEEIIDSDLKSGKHPAIQTRFPPEPNGFLHIGHAMSICLNFGLAEKFGGKCNLRFDDTNPAAEEQRFVDGMKEDIAWLGFKWDQELYASNYFQQLYDWAIQLIKAGKAYVDDSSQEEMSRMRGVPTRPGEESPYRNRSVEENLELFEGMQAGKYDEGSRVLRAKIDMSSPNMHMRDPVLYRILKLHHHQTGDKWKVYPTYDYAHGQSDSIEGVTHSLCTLEFEVHRPLYNWLIENIDIFPSRQIEFAGLQITYIVTSKRRLRHMVTEGIVTGWDDPRMPTISGLRRRGFTPASIRNFVARTGVTKADAVHDLALLHHSIREDLNKTAPRVMAVLDPLKVVLTNWPADKVEDMEVINNPEDPEGGSRTMPFSRELYIERADFMEEPPKKFFRLGPGREVRLKGGYIIQCHDFVKDAEGNITELHCTYDPQTRSGQDTSGKKVKGTIHWVSAAHALDVEARLIEPLFTVEEPLKDDNKEGDDHVPWTEYINPNSMEILQGVKAEPSLAKASVGDRFQFMRKGYFVLDRDSTGEKLVFNRTATLRDSWSKKQKKG